MEDDIPEVTKEECTWALTKWRTSCKPTTGQVSEIVDRMVSEGLALNKYPCNGLTRTHDPGRFFDQIVKLVAARQGDWLKIFLHILEDQCPGMGDPRFLLRMAGSPCDFKKPTLFPSERGILDDAKDLHDLRILRCPKCNGIMQDPVLLKCLHSCCKLCLGKDDSVCPACKVKHDGEPVRNHSLVMHMKFWATKIASAKCVTCLSPEERRGEENLVASSPEDNCTSPEEASPLPPIIPSTFCHKCNAYYCSTHSTHCCTNGHKLERKEEYLEKKKDEFYQLSCSFHERKMVHYCRDCSALRCELYKSRCSNCTHTYKPLDQAAKGPRDYMKRFLELHRLPMDKAVDSHLEMSCKELQTLYKNLLVENRKSAVEATKLALCKAEQAIEAYCTSLEEYFKPLLYCIDQAGIYFNFLLDSGDAWIVQQWSVVYRQLHLLMHQTGIAPPDFAQFFPTGNLSPTALQSSTARTHDGSNGMLLHVDYVNPLSGTLAPLIEQLVGVPKQKSADSPAYLFEMLKAVQNDAKSVMKQKEHFDIVTNLKEQVAQLQRENEELRSKQKTIEEPEAKSSLSFQSGCNLMDNLRRASAEVCQKMSHVEVQEVVYRLRSLDLLCPRVVEDIQKKSDTDTEAAEKLINLVLKRDQTFAELFLKFLREHAKRTDIVNYILSANQ